MTNATRIGMDSFTISRVGDHSRHVRYESAVVCQKDGLQETVQISVLLPAGQTDTAALLDAAVRRSMEILQAVIEPAPGT